MTVAYDDSTWTSNGATHHYGVCKTVPTVGDVTTTAWSFNYNNGTGVTRLHCPGHDPNVSAVTMVRQGAAYNLFTMSSCEDCKVQGVEARLSGINVAGGAYGISLDTCTGCTAEGCTTADNSDHGFGAIGNTNDSNTFQGCISLACSWTSTNFVHYAGGAGFVVNGRTIDSTAHVISYLNGENEDLYAAAEIVSPTQQGFYCHTNTANQVTSLLYEGTRAWVYMPTAGASAGGSNRKGYGAGDQAVFAGASATDRAGRSVKYVRCSSRGDTSMSLGNQHFQACSFHFTNAGPSMPSPAGFFYCVGGGGVTFYSVPLFEGCEIIANMDRTSGAESGVLALSGTFATGEGPTFIGSTIINIGVSGTTSYLFDYNGKAGFAVRGYQNILGHTGKIAGLCAGDTALPSSVHIFRSNAYIQVLDAANGFSLNASFDTFSEWKSTIDTSAVPQMLTATQAGFTDTSISGELSISSSVIRGLQVTNVLPSLLFLNTEADAGIPGAWQYPVRRATPTSMVQAGSWVDEAAGTTNLHQKIDETLPDTSDYVTNNYTSGTLIVGLSAIAKPLTWNNHVIRTMYQFNDSGVGNFTLTVTLREGTTTRATRTITVDAGVGDWVIDVWNLTPANLVAIHDYSALRIGLAVTTGGGENVYVAWCNLEVEGAVRENIPLPKQRHLLLLSQ
jgi:hypothetical protein